MANDMSLDALANDAARHAARNELTRLRAEVARLTQERDGWPRTAIEMANNADFYRGIVHQAGAHFGVAAYTSDDGSVQDEVLALKVPELAEQAVAERDALRAVLVDVRAVVAELVAVDRRRLSRVVADIDAALASEQEAQHGE